MEKVANRLIVISNDFNEIRKFLNMVKWYKTNFGKCSRGCPLGWYLIAIEGEILKKNVCLQKIKVQILYAFQINTLFFFWAVLLLRKKFGDSIQLLKRCVLIKEIGLQIKKTERKLDEQKYENIDIDFFMHFLASFLVVQ